MRYSCNCMCQACGSSRFTLVGITQNIQGLGGTQNTFRTLRQTKEPFIVKCYFNGYRDYVQYEIT